MTISWLSENDDFHQILNHINLSYCSICCIYGLLLHSRRDVHFTIITTRVTHGYLSRYGLKVPSPGPSSGPPSRHSVRGGGISELIRTIKLSSRRNLYKFSFIDAEFFERRGQDLIGAEHHSPIPTLEVSRGLGPLVTLQKGSWS